MKSKRKVKIERRGDVWMVLYVNRRPRQRFLAAQFDCSMLNESEVKQWIAENPRLELVQENWAVLS